MTLKKMGRPRMEEAGDAILRATLRLVSTKGFRVITMDQIAAQAGVGKMTIYRRWPNKSTLVMQALLTLVGPHTDFPDSARALDSLRQQLRLQAAFFRSRYGRLIRSLLAEAQSNEELARAFRQQWILPRRRGVVATLRAAVEQGELREKLDLEVATDILYAPFYYRLLIGTGAMDDSFIDSLLGQFLSGHRR